MVLRSARVPNGLVEVAHCNRLIWKSSMEGQPVRSQQESDATEGTGAVE
jgi:hypothetical protein